MNEFRSPLHNAHPRTYLDNRFVYPVLSRRAKGLSIGVNLNPDKVCNFHCIYCQVDRTLMPSDEFVDIDRLSSELDGMLAFVKSGDIYDDDCFKAIPTAVRRLNDIAFSGDGEPTTFRNFDKIALMSAELKAKHELNDVKLVLITNASMLHRPHVQLALETFDQNHGEIWAKLDAGTEMHYNRIAQTKVPFQRVLNNSTEAAQRRPIVIQSLFMAINGTAPAESEIDAYCERLQYIVGEGGEIKLIQLYTIARRPADPSVSALPRETLDRFAETVCVRTGLRTEIY